jgi:hypothetical protein
VLFEAHFTKLADDQFLTALELELKLIQTQMAQKPMLRVEVYAHALRASQNARGIAALQDSDEPRARAKEPGCSPRPTQDKTWPQPRSGSRS